MIQNTENIKLSWWEEKNENTCHKKMKWIKNEMLQIEITIKSLRFECKVHKGVLAVHVNIYLVRNFCLKLTFTCGMFIVNDELFHV